MSVKIATIRSYAYESVSFEPMSKLDANVIIRVMKARRMSNKRVIIHRRVLMTINDVSVREFITVRVIIVMLLTIGILCFNDNNTRVRVTLPHGVGK